MKTIPLLNSIKDISLIEKNGVIIVFDPQEEDVSPLDQFEDTEQAKEVCEKYNNGNFAAWFCAKVTVKYKGFESTDYLGCCSYNSFKEFTTAENDCFVDMINTCINGINVDIKRSNFETQKFWDIRKAKNLINKYGLFIIGSNKLQTL